MGNPFLDSAKRRRRSSEKNWEKGSEKIKIRDLKDCQSESWMIISKNNW